MTVAPRLLLVEDEPGLRLTLTDRLVAEGYVVSTEADGQAGLAAALRGEHDVIVLDVMLPALNGLDVCRMLRSQRVSTPVLMLTAKGQVADKVAGLKLGADDYLTKPFETIELLARLEALIRRRSAGPQVGGDRYRVGAIEVDVRKAEVTRDGRVLDLSAREFRLLKYFIEHRGETLSRETLLADVWGYDDTPLTRTVDVHVAGLRQKLETNPKQPEYLVTMHGLGYKFTG